MIKKIAVLIPALDPPFTLISFCRELSKDSTLKVIIVDDGSKRAQPVFDALSCQKNLTIIVNPKNLGKGGALKVGFEFVERFLSSECLGVITVDADGQHLLEDVRRMIAEVRVDKDAFVIGRRCSLKGAARVPLRSLVGNFVTKYIFRAVSGIRLSDSQCGLRFYPIKLVETLGGLDSNAYDYETEVFFEIKRCGTQIRELDIEKVYLENNNSSHFRPLIDSMRIYWVFIRHTYVSIISSLVDLSVFYLMWMISGNTFLSICVSRVFALIFYVYGLSNFAYYKSVTTKTCIRICLLVLMSVVIIPSLINFALDYLGNILVAKIISESIWFLFNFFVLRKVFS